jgi:CRISPR/Cas system CSM-associated protein Csm4 (group 5 of RAMP superfamily)
LDKEKRELFERVIDSEQLAGDRERDLELKDIKIESLENIIKKREAIPVPSPRIDEKQTEKIYCLLEKIQKLTYSKARLESKLEKAEAESTSKIKEHTKKQVEI